jgi:hypothetical protein
MIGVLRIDFRLHEKSGALWHAVDCRKKISYVIAAAQQKI